MPRYMPEKPGQPDNRIYVVSKNGQDQRAHVLKRSEDKAYIHYLDTDKRMDEWVSADDIRPVEDHESTREHSPVAGPSGSHLTPEPMDVDEHSPLPLSEEAEAHKQITASRNFEKVNFGTWQIKTWYFSPYPVGEEDPTAVAADPRAPTSTIQGVNRASMKSHGRTSDLYASGLGRVRGNIEDSILWVCDKCFKYMHDDQSWARHTKHCKQNHPPGRKVYQRGAHTIWEVDGAKEKLYCQNLSLFGKLFIDIKTLFFDCDNFLFYIMTDATTHRDHVMAFFSKEKVSYDEYNLACIVTLPPYQRKGYGILLIEFSYELSRRTGIIGTPERPLSDLGLRSYLAYWVATIVRFLRRLLSVVPPELPKLISAGNDSFANPPIEPQDLGKGKNKKKVKGFEVEAAVAPPHVLEDPIFSQLRTVVSTPHPDGSATSHVVVECTLEDIARATCLRVDDAAFALNECGLLMRKERSEDPEGEDNEEYIVAISREMIEKIAVERKVKRTCIDLSHVLL